MPVNIFPFSRAKWMWLFGGVTGYPGGLWVLLTAACFQLDWRACQSFLSPKKRCQVMARSRGRQQHESQLVSFPLTSNPEVLKLIPHKDSPSLWCLFEIRWAIMTFLRCLLVKIAPVEIERLPRGPPDQSGWDAQQSAGSQGNRLAWLEVLPSGRKWPLAQMAAVLGYYNLEPLMLPRSELLTGPSWERVPPPGQTDSLSSNKHFLLKEPGDLKGTRPEH